MRRPTRIELFDALFAAVSAQGRGPTLFGNAEEGTRTFFQRSLIGSDFPAMHFEFPLKGKPCLDLLAIYDHVPPASSFSPGGGYGYQEAFDWFSAMDAPGSSIGIELDLSQGVTDQAGIYLQQRNASELVRPFLEVLGEEAREESYRAMVERMPRGWPAAYVGLFPARVGSPLRLGGYLAEPSRRRCANDPAFLASRLDLMGFSAYDDEMLERCTQLMAMAPVVDFQFDLTPDGNLTETFGLSLSFGQCKPSEIGPCFATGYAGDIMRTFQEWGLADDRWRLIPSAFLARRIDFEREDGSTGQLVATIRLNFAKVKFVRAVPQTAKFYLVAMVHELGRQ